MKKLGGGGGVAGREGSVGGALLMWKNLAEKKHAKSVKQKKGAGRSQRLLGPEHVKKGREVKVRKKEEKSVSSMNEEKVCPQ